MLKLVCLFCVCVSIKDVPELHHRFLKLSLMVPRAPLVFFLPNTVDTIKNKVLPELPEPEPESYEATSFEELPEPDNSFDDAAEVETEAVLEPSACTALQDCDYDGTIYKTGESFPSSDGCNSCFCSNGAVACTLKFCLPKPTCKYGNQTYNDGESFKALDGCNTCGCHNGMIACTEMFCLPVDQTPIVL